MAVLTIRNLDDAVRDRLRVQAARNGRSMEAEARAILRRSVAGDAGESAGDVARRMRARFADVGGFDVELPSREALGAPSELPE